MTIDPQQYKALLSGSNKRRNKYKALSTGGYASRRECNRAATLKLLLKQGLISNLREQVRYQLIPPQYIDGKLVERAVAYVADFVYTDSNGCTVVEDTKGFRTPEYIIKRKLMLAVHGIKILET